MNANSLRTSMRPVNHACMAACVAAAALCVAQPARAQSSVTLYGLIDTGVERVSNVGAGGSTLVRMPSLTGSLPSRWGMRGNEDLGAGLKAVFVVESGFAPDKGTSNQGGRLFGRQAFVGLQGSFGQVSFGRQYSQLFYSAIGETYGPHVNGPVGLLDSYFPNARLDNSIAYRGSFGNVTVGTTYSLGRDTAGPGPAGGCVGEVAGDALACRDLSALLQYATKAWGVAAGFERMWGGAAAAGPSTLPLSRQHDTRTLINGFYQLGNLRLGAGLVRRSNQASTTQPDSRLIWLGGTYVMGKVQTDMQFGQLNFKNSPNDSRAVSARVMYNFTRRTAVYTSVARMTNKGAAALSVSGGDIAGAAPAPGMSQNGLMVGLRHVF